MQMQPQKYSHLSEPQDYFFLGNGKSIALLKGADFHVMRGYYSNQDQLRFLGAP